MENFDNIPSESVKLQVGYLINTLRSNAGLYDSDEVSTALYALREEIRKSSHEKFKATEEEVAP